MLVWALGVGEKFYCVTITVSEFKGFMGRPDLTLGDALMHVPVIMAWRRH